MAEAPVPLIIRASVFGESGKKLPYTSKVPSVIVDKHSILVVEAPCLSFRVEILLKPEHTVKDIIDSCIEYRKKLAKERKGTRILGSSLIPFNEKFFLTVRGKKKPKKLSTEATISSLKMKSQVSANKQSKKKLTNIYIFYVVGCLVSPRKTKDKSMYH